MEPSYGQWGLQKVLECDITKWMVGRKEKPETNAKAPQNGLDTVDTKNLHDPRYLIPWE